MATYMCLPTITYLLAPTFQYLPTYNVPTYQYLPTVLTYCMLLPTSTCALDKLSLRRRCALLEAVLTVTPEHCRVAQNLTARDHDRPAPGWEPVDRDFNVIKLLHCKIA